MSLSQFNPMWQMMGMPSGGMEMFPFSQGSSLMPPMMGMGMDPFAELPMRRISVDVKETDNAFELVADVPGFEKDEVKLDVEEDILTISAEQSRTKEDEGITWRRKERHYGSSKRTLRLPPNVNLERVTAKHENGVLSVTLPKLAITESKPRSQIRIS